MEKRREGSRNLTTVKKTVEFGRSQRPGSPKSQQVPDSTLQTVAFAAAPAGRMVGRVGLSSSMELVGRTNHLMLIGAFLKPFLKASNREIRISAG
jgi:hypothetical protein